MTRGHRIRHPGGIVLAHSRHRGELGIESLLPDETVEAMHAALGTRTSRFGRRLRARIARLMATLRPALSAS